MKNYILTALVAFVLGGVTVHFIMYEPADLTVTDEVEERAPVVVETDPVVEKEPEEETEEPEEDTTMTVLGESADGNDVVAYHFGEGDKELLLVSGIHGGYSWNTALLGFQIKEYFESNEGELDDVRVTVVPVLNPDGLERVVGTTGEFSAADAPSNESERIEGRFNGNDVDLNRNFDCQWEEDGVWKNQKVSGGTKPFSEPEADALRDYIQENEPAAVVAYYSSAGGVYSSNCGDKPLAETLELTNLYADAAEYDAFEEFDFYEVTGDMVNWFASENIPAISVLLTSPEDVEWSKNRRGIEAVLEYLE